MSSRDHDRPRHHKSSRRDKPISRSRSRSPTSYRDQDRKRSRSHRHHHRDRDIEDSRDTKRKSHQLDHRGSRKHEDTEAPPQPLPFGSRQLTKRDLTHYEPVLGMYLDIQKSLILEDLSEKEVKGRWKSFIGKWNRGELAEGWYDPDTLEKARNSSHHRATSPIRDRTRSPEPETRTRERSRSNTDLDRPDSEEYEDEDDEFHGPSLPHQQSLSESPRGHTSHAKSGPTIPKTEDLQIQRELSRSTHDSEKSHSRSLHRQAVTSHKSELKHIEEEVAPRAEPGTHERRMEKRQERAAANRSFAQSARGGSPVDAMGDDELMGGGGGAGGGGGGGDSLEAMKQEREKETRKKNDRELRREEMLRARVAEREERMEAYRRKEDETMSVLKALAKQRFG